MVVNEFLTETPQLMRGQKKFRNFTQTPNKELPSSIEESSLVFLKAKVMSLYP